MVVGGQLYAKIDRPAGTVRFAKHPEPEQLLNSWSNNISKLLNVVNRRCAAPQCLPLCLVRVVMCFDSADRGSQSAFCLQLPANTEGVHGT